MSLNVDVFYDDLIELSSLRKGNFSEYDDPEAVAKHGEYTEQNFDDDCALGLFDLD